MYLKLTNSYGKLNRIKEEYPYAYYFYHFTDISNIPSILKHENLFSRSKCQELGIPVSDSASEEIITATDNYKKKYVRLYFRPLTPMQYHIEGFVPVGKRYKDAHCPIPVFLLFDSMPLLTRSDFRYSEGNFASPGSRLMNKRHFEILPFEEIYSTGPFHNSAASEKFHRQAEVLFKDSLPLTSLKYIVCRSRAEHQMLQFLLHKNGLDRWSSKVVLIPTMKLFYSQRLYVKEIFLSEEYAYILFNCFLTYHRVSLRIENLQTSEVYSETFDYVRINQVERVDDFFLKGMYLIKITIDGILAHESIVEII